MKKKILLPFLLSSLLIFSSCGSDSPNEEPPVSGHTLESLELSDKKTQYTVGESFVKPTVTAIYDDGDRLNVTSLSTFSGYNMSVEGFQTVYVSYDVLTTNYTIHVQKSSVIEDVTVSSIAVYDQKTSYKQGETFVKPSVIATFSNGDELDVTSSATFSGYNLNNLGNQTVNVSYTDSKNKTVTTSYSITVVEGASLFAFNSEDSGYFEKTNNLTTNDHVFDNKFTFSFAQNSASEAPNSSKDGDGYVRLLNGASMTISCISSLVMTEIKLIHVSGYAKGYIVGEETISPSNGVVTVSGEYQSITFITPTEPTSGHNRITRFEITYCAEQGEKPDFGEVTTVKEVLDYTATLQKGVDYIPNNVGWYCTDISVTLKVKAIDGIDSKSSSASQGYDPNAQAKIVAMDDTGVILLSSGTKSNPTKSLYQRVKDYIKSGTATYKVKGKIAFLNDVVEVVVADKDCAYDSSISLTKSIKDFAVGELNSSDTFATECYQEIITNNDGYGVKDIKEFKGLTYFDTYNYSAGGYLFVDQAGKIVPVYSWENKDRSSFIKGNCYDIVGLESMYEDRPSFRVLSVSHSSLEKADFDFAHGVNEVTDLTTIYNIKPGNLDYVLSQFKLFSADVYVSTYGNNKYTFNTTYYKYNGSYTTGHTEDAMASHNSLFIKNSDDIDSHQALLDYLIDDCASEEEVKEKRVKLYFTLTETQTVGGKTYWKVTVLEDLIYSIDYYNADEISMDFRLSDENTSVEINSPSSQTWTRTGCYDGIDLSVVNESTSLASMSYNYNYLKVNNGTKLTINCSRYIIGFTLYKSSISYVAGLGDLDIEAYKQFGEFITIKLRTPVKVVEMDPVYVSATGNTDYLKFTSMSVRLLQEN